MTTRCPSCAVPLEGRVRAAIGSPLLGPEFGNPFGNQTYGTEETFKVCLD
jgi:hypothetical protein